MRVQIAYLSILA